MSYEVTGKLIWAGETEKKTESFQAREFAIETPDDKYPQAVKFQLVQDRCDLLDNFTEGDMLKVHFDLRGREWNGKYFTNLNAWKIEKEGGAPAPAKTEKKPPEPSFPSTDAPASEEKEGADDDLPF